MNCEYSVFCHSFLSFFDFVHLSPCTVGHTIHPQFNVKRCTSPTSLCFSFSLLKCMFPGSICSLKNNILPYLHKFALTFIHRKSHGQIVGMTTGVLTISRSSFIQLESQRSRKNVRKYSYPVLVNKQNALRMHFHNVQL